MKSSGSHCPQTWRLSCLLASVLMQFAGRISNHIHGTKFLRCLPWTRAPSLHMTGSERLSPHPASTVPGPRPGCYTNDWPKPFLLFIVPSLMSLSDIFVLSHLGEMCVHLHIFLFGCGRRVFLREIATNKWQGTVWDVFLYFRKSQRASAAEEKTKAVASVCVYFSVT